MKLLAIIGVLATFAALWVLIRAVLMVRRHREGIRRAGVSAGHYVVNENLCRDFRHGVRRCARGNVVGDALM